MGKDPDTRGRTLIATSSFSARWEGADWNFAPYDYGSTVEEGHPILKGIEHLFEVMVPQFKIEREERWETATSAPGEKRGG